QSSDPDPCRNSARQLRSVRRHSVCGGRVLVTQPVLRWRVAPPPDPDTARQLASSLDLPPALARLLAQRGYGELETAKRFLRPELQSLSDPYALAGMADAVEVIVRTIRAGHRILVHGDYDVDGQC